MLTQKGAGDVGEVTRSGPHKWGDDGDWRRLLRLYPAGRPEKRRICWASEAVFGDGFLYRAPCRRDEGASWFMTRDKLGKVPVAHPAYLGQ